ncbi:DUF3054 domain-containing protein [Sanguibacter suaedae]|uniref:DUF3054 domain-containing protein n=1 Tax=Sanguibacter suaedae TaxID=2795737 RepID=A0A934M9Z5_9MICO|nr:DUF3054 domain-containing protein [Sanguibacter suaedae]MBI9115090.1 DUF3054 domain-containing protein [Sanguibacter suaedae]
MRIPWWSTLGIDVVCVLAFAAAGRSSHAEENTPGALVGTAWPFLVGLAVGWAVLAVVARRRDAGGQGPTTWARPVAIGVPLVVITWSVAMVLRATTDQGLSGAFPAVALGVLAALLVGWRCVAVLVSGAARPRSAGRGHGTPAPGG